jgi:hypothetical protein
MEVDYVMCAIMAFSSPHMAYFKPEKKELYTSQADHLYGAAQPERLLKRKANILSVSTR